MTAPTTSAVQPGWVQVLAIGLDAERTIQFLAQPDGLKPEAGNVPAETAQCRLLYRLRSEDCVMLEKSARRFLRPYRIADTKDVSCDAVIAVAVIDAFENNAGETGPAPDFGAGPIDMDEVRHAFAAIDLPRQVQFVKLRVLQKYVALGFTPSDLESRARIISDYGVRADQSFVSQLRHFGHFQRMTQTGIDEFFEAPIEAALERMHRYHILIPSYFDDRKEGADDRGNGFDFGDFIAKPAKTEMSRLREACVRYLENSMAAASLVPPAATTLAAGGMAIYIAQGPQGTLCRVGVSDMSDEKLNANLNRIHKFAINQTYGRSVDFAVIKRYPVAAMRPASVFVQMMVEAYASADHRAFVKADLVDLKQEIDRFMACWSIHTDRHRTRSVAMGNAG